MKAIVYVSKTSTPFDTSALQKLAHQAAECNAKLDITGYLWFDDGLFLQYLEGDAERLDELMARLEQDERHQMVNQAEESDVAERRFPGWNMQFIQDGDFAGISMEKILANQLTLMRPNGNAMKEWHRQIWSTVNSLSNLQGRIKDVDG